MLCENRLQYSCGPLGVASYTLCEPLCQAASCCEDVYGYSVHFCDVLVRFSDRIFSLSLNIKV